MLYQTIRPDPSALSARDLASRWRTSPDERAHIEAALTMDDRWDEFRFSSHGELIAKFTDADRAHRESNRGCDSYFRSDKAMGLSRGLEL